MAKPRTATITVPLGDDLLARVNTVAKARKQSAAEFVREVLDEKTKKLQKLVDEIREREVIIQKEYDSDSENGQGPVRSGSAPDARKSPTKKRRSA